MASRSATARARPSRARRIAAGLLALLVALVAGIWLGGHPGWIPSSIRGAFVSQGNTRLVAQVLDMISHDYYRHVDSGQLVNDGLGAMVASLHDPYSHYFSPSDYRSFMNQSNPHLSGVGIDVDLDRRGLRVVDVFPGSPAARAGLLPGDVIVAVGSTSLASRSADFGSSLIKGRAGTQVSLTVLRAGRRRVVPITRANIVVPVATARVIRFRHIRIGHLTLTTFTEGSGDQLRQRVSQMLHRGVKAVILDMRQNGGGLLGEAVNVASIFIPDGTIVSTAGRAQPRQVYTARGNAIAPRIPLVVLVDRGTASAAEIVTGALQDRGRAKVVGTRTYGKGVFQEIQTLPNGGALDITVGEYFTPNGTNLGGGGVREGRGIRPNVSVVGNPPGAHDAALQLAERTVAAGIQ
ncbi:MAG: S41 family peptidase [Actinomycetota bacterium]|nr:S41 family peptidase [Actinomycetota bacterium]